jgi:hypothetical protein
VVEQPTKLDFFINLKAGQADRPDESTECAGSGRQSHQVTFSILDVVVSEVEPLPILRPCSGQVFD